MNPWILCALLPMLTFPLLLLAESRTQTRLGLSDFDTNDWILNISGFFMQGLVIPGIGFLLANYFFPAAFPQLHRCLQIGFVGAFVLNFVGVDFLYYLQHRAFHRIPWLWRLHAPHHYSPTVNVWATSRNALVTHFFFVYMLVSPILAYLCDVTEGFFAGAMLTAALDLVRHAKVNLRLPGLENIVLMPHEHHRHHDADQPEANFGANFILWDRLFGTFEPGEHFPSSYAAANAPSLKTQLLFPWRSS
jgi:sterol desaturase/sphingolipid hydroxylase (fatty acid hydroxylase superfamily)